MLKHLYPALAATFIFAFLTGLVFPLTITAIASLCFPYQAHGSLIARSIAGSSAAKTIIGSELLGQTFKEPKYFHPRPSAAGDGYSAIASGGTNLGPTSAKLINGNNDFSGIRQLVKAYREENQLAADDLVPVDAVTRSGSGLDSDISPANAAMQMSRVAAARHVDVATIKDVLSTNTQTKLLGFIGEHRVNVLKLNLALDKMSEENQSKQKESLVHK